MRLTPRGWAPIFVACLITPWAPTPSAGQDPADSSSSFTAEIAAQRSAQILPGDRISLRIWREPDWSGQFHVDDRGIVVLPRLGHVQVNGQSVDEVREMLTERYAQFLRTPAIEVTVLRRIAVHGEVKAPTQ